MIEKKNAENPRWVAISAVAFVAAAVLGGEAWLFERIDTTVARSTATSNAQILELSRAVSDQAAALNAMALRVNTVEAREGELVRATEHLASTIEQLRAGVGAQIEQLRSVEGDLTAALRATAQRLDDLLPAATSPGGRRR